MSIEWKMESRHHGKRIKILIKTFITNKPSDYSTEEGEPPRLNNKFIPKTYKLIGWNWRTMSQEKTWFSNNLLSKYKPDFMVVCETWVTKQINLYNKDYEVNQAEYAPHQGVWIITKLGYTTKVWKSNEPYFITVQWGEADPIFIIGAYFKIVKQKAIMEQIKKKIKR